MKAVRIKAVNSEKLFPKRLLSQRPIWLYSFGPYTVRTILFVLAFSIPLALVWNIGGSKTEPDSYFKDLEKYSRALGPTSQRITFLGSENLNPPPDKDYIVFSTWKLHALPAPGERAVLISKTKAKNRFVGDNSQGGDGYALGLINDAGTTRFMLAWPGSGGLRWMRVGEAQLTAGDWFTVALSVRKQVAVGAFFVPLSGSTERPNVTVLGGFTVTGFAGDSNEPLSLAPTGSGKFMARVGPSGILRGANLGGEEIELLRQFALNPTAAPKSLNRNQVILFWNGNDAAVGSEKKHNSEEYETFPLTRGVG